MNPRMKEKGIPVQPGNGLQIRNPWIPQTPGNLIHPRSNEISTDRNGNPVERRNWSEFFELLERRAEQMSNRSRAGENYNLNEPLNNNSGSYGIRGHQMGNGTLRVDQTLNQSSSSYGMNGHQMGNGIIRGANNFDLRGPANQIRSSNGTGNHIGNGIVQIGSNTNFTGPLNQFRTLNGMSHHQLRNGSLQAGNNFNLAGAMNQIKSSNGTGNHGNGIMRGSNYSNFTGPLNQITTSNSMVDHRMQNENLGHYLNSQMQTHRNDISSWSSSAAPNGGLIRNMVQQPVIPATNMTANMIPNTDPVISSSYTDPMISTSLLNLNMQPLSSTRVMNLPNAPILNSYSEVDSSWTEGNFTSLLLGDEIPDLGPNNNWLNANNLQQMLNYGSHVPVLRDSNLISPPRHAGDAKIRNANSFPSAPITPDHANLLEKYHQAEMLKFLVGDGSCQEHDKMDNMFSTIGNEAVENHCSELLQTIVGSSFTVVSTPQAENNSSDARVDENVINLNETPNQKAPKRRKHRPKVVIEGKPKRTPKTKTPKNSESQENPSRKRKYVRKNRDPEGENATPQQTDVNEVKGPSMESREESCRKRLNFDFENAEKGESQCTQAGYHQGNHPVLDLNLNYPANQIPVESLIGEERQAPNGPPGIINYNTLNLIAQNLSMGNNENQENKILQGEMNKNNSQRSLNLERSREMRWKSSHQMVERDVGNFKGFYESMGEDFHSTEQVGPYSEHKLSSPSKCRETFWSEKQDHQSPKVGTSSKETRKKQKMENDLQKMLSRPEKEHCLTGAYGESTINAENYMQRKLTALKQQIERTRGRMQSRSIQAQSTGCIAIMPNSGLQSAITSKNAHASGYQQESEKYQASMQNNGLKITPNPCRAISFCSQKGPFQGGNDSSRHHGQPSMKVRGQPKSMKYSKKTVDEITRRLQSLTINGEKEGTYGKDKYALVPYEGGGAMITYEPRKRKPRPKVDLDPETTRIWKLLMGKEGSEASEAQNKDKEKWWEEERRVFHGRAESFIARMHLVQGDRRFSPWKGSVVDSIIGVFLTQNVSDQLSSSAFMALAAQFPLCSTTTDQTSDQSGTSILTEEQEIQRLAPNGTAGCFEKIMRQPFHNQTSETYLGSLGTGSMVLTIEHNKITKENASSPQNSSDSSVHHINGEIQFSSESSSEAEDSSNGGKSIKNNGPASVQQANRTAPDPLQVVNNPEKEWSCYDDRSMHYYNQSRETDHNRQKQGSDRLNNLNSFSHLNRSIDSSISDIQNSTTPLSYLQMLMAPQVARSEVDCFEILREECRSSFPSIAPEMTKGKSIGYQDNRFEHAAEMTRNTLFQQNGLQNSPMPNIDLFEFLTKSVTIQKNSVDQVPQIGKDKLCLNTHQVERSRNYESDRAGFHNPSRSVEPFITRKSGSGNQVPNVSKHVTQTVDIQEGTTEANEKVFLNDRSADGHTKGQARFPGETNAGVSAKMNMSQKHEKAKRESFDWDSLRRMVQSNARGKERSMDASDSMDYEAMRCADVNVISNSIRIRGMNNMLSERIKDFLNRVATDHGSIDLEWLRDVPPDKAKDYLLSIWGLGLKSVECVRLLTLHHLAFPVDTNVGRIAVRLGWVPLQPLPESLQLHLLEMYPVLESVQKYLWPRLCKLDQKTLYELHYQLITFGKVFCTKSKPNCNACPMRGECRHFASAFASARLALPAPEEKGIVGSTMPIATDTRANVAIKPMLLQPSGSNGERELMVSRCEPIIEEPATPEQEITDITETDIEDAFYEDPDEIPTIRLNVEQLAVNLRNLIEEHTDLQGGDMSKALVALTPEAASIPVPKLKYILRLRTERQVYVLPDTHPLIKGLDKRETDDPSPYLFASLAPDEESSSGQSSGRCCECRGTGELCSESCSLVNREANSLTVRGTLLIPCRTAMRGSFPLNGTYFQVNEVFADHESSLNPIDVPRAWLWHLETRTVFFGTSATSIFRGMTTKEIQNSFWRGFVCVRGFDQKTRAPRPLNRNLHLAQSKIAKTSNGAQ